jgi:photosystem II stability/assembly factor-like uncharacterized protein
VPTGFAATSITFVSAGEAFVLGTAHAHQAVILRTIDRGTTWNTVGTSDDGGAGWADLGFTSNLAGVVVHGPAVSDGNPGGRPGEVLLTGNGGATWHRVSF